MNPLCVYLQPVLNFVLQIPYNLFNGLGLTPVASIFSTLYEVLSSLIGCGF